MYVVWGGVQHEAGYVRCNAYAASRAPQRRYFVRSTDAAATWRNPSDVSLAPTATNIVFPARVAVGDGDVRVAWQDDRNGATAWNTWYPANDHWGVHLWKPDPPE